MNTILRTIVAALLLCFVGLSSAHAQDTEPATEPPPTQPERPRVSAEPPRIVDQPAGIPARSREYVSDPNLHGSTESLSDDREVPDYDGREDPKATVGESLLWIPRVVLYPVYLVSEYVLRRPMGAVVIWIEKNHIGGAIADVFTFGEDGRFGVFPTGLLDFGLRPSVGLYLFANNSPVDDARFRLHFAYGGSEWWRVSVRERFMLGDTDAPNRDFGTSEVSIHLLYDQRPDHLFRGIGLNQAEPQALAYLWRQLGATVSVDGAFGELDGARLELHASRNEFGPGDGELGKADRSIDAVYDLNDTDALPGIDGYTLLRVRGELTLDSRPEDLDEVGSGGRLSLFGGVSTDLDDSGGSWATYGAAAGAYWDVDGRGRVLSLHQRVELADPLGDGAVPFAEMPTLGGHVAMRGFVEERFRGRSVSATTAQYRYPVWAFLDGFAFYSVGNAYGAGFEDFGLGTLASSFGMGMRSNSDRDAGFTFLVGAGTGTFDEEFRIDEVRVLFGVQRGY